MPVILLATPDAQLSARLEQSLRAAGRVTVVEREGAGAMEQIATRTFHAVFIDLDLSAPGGFEALRALRARPGGAATPVALLARRVDKAVVMRAKQLGVGAVLLTSTDTAQQIVARLLAPAAPARAAGQDGEEAEGGLREAPMPARFDPICPLVDPSLPADPAQRLLTIAPILKRAEVMERLDGETAIKAISPVVAEVLRLTGAELTSVEHVARAILQDQAISLKTVRIANSALYNRGERADSVQRAALRIGLTQIRQIVMNVAVMERFSSPAVAAVLPTHLFWEHSIVTAHLAGHIAAAHGKMRPETAFTIGLLHDTGQMALAETLGEQYALVIDTARRLELPLEQVEKRMLQVHHGEIMERLLRAWNFPPEMIRPIVHHHDSVEQIRRAAIHEATECMTVSLADRLAHALLLGETGSAHLGPTEELCRALRLTPADLRRIETAAPEEAMETKVAMMTAWDQDEWPEVRERIARCGPPGFRPLFVGANPALDGYRLLCESLTRGGPVGAPNICVAHLAEGREKAWLTGAVPEAERGAGVANLPLIVLSPSERLRAEDTLLAGRAHAHLVTPLTAVRALDTARKLLGGAGRSAAA